VTFWPLNLQVIEKKKTFRKKERVKAPITHLEEIICGTYFHGVPKKHDQLELKERKW